MRRSGYLQEGCPQVLERREKKPPQQCSKRSLLQKSKRSKTRAGPVRGKSNASHHPQVSLEKQEVATLLSHLSHHLEWREALLQDLKRFVAQVSLRDAEAQPDSEDEIRFVPFPPTTPVPAAEVDSSNLVGRKAHGKTRQQIVSLQRFSESGDTNPFKRQQTEAESKSDSLSLVQPSELSGERETRELVQDLAASHAQSEIHRGKIAPRQNEKITTTTKHHNLEGGQEHRSLQGPFCKLTNHQRGIQEELQHCRDVSPLFSCSLSDIPQASSSFQLPTNPVEPSKAKSYIVPRKNIPTAAEQTPFSRPPLPLLHSATTMQKEHCEEEPQQNTGASSSNSDPPTTQNEKKLIGEGYLQVGRADLEQTNGSHHHHGETTQNSEFPPPFQSRLSTTVPRQEKKDNEPREPDQNKTEERRSQTDSHDLAGAQPSAVKSRMEVPNPLPHQHAIESSGAFQSGTAAGPFLRPASVPKVCTESKGLVVRESLEEHSPSSMLSHTPWKLHLVPPLVGKNLEPDPSDMREAFHLQRGGNHELGTQPLSIFRVQQNESSRIKTENRRRTDERNAEGWNDKNTQKAIIHPEKTVAASQGTHKSFFNDLSHGAFPPSRQAIQCVAQPASNNSSPSSFPPPEFFKRQVAATCATPNRPLPEAKCTERDSLQVPLRVTTTNPRLHTEDPPHPLQPSPSASSLEQTPGEKSSAMHRGETENGIMEEMTGAWNLRSQKGLHRKPAEPSSKDGAPGDNVCWKFAWEPRCGSLWGQESLAGGLSEFCKPEGALSGVGNCTKGEHAAGANHDSISSLILRMNKRPSRDRYGFSR